MQVNVKLDLPELPCADPRMFSSNRLDCRVNAEQAETMRRMRVSLQAQGVQLGPVHPVKTNADVVRWLLDRVAEALDDGAGAIHETKLTPADTAGDRASVPRDADSDGRRRGKHRNRNRAG